MALFRNDVKVKGIVHPSMENLSSFTHSHVIPKPYKCFLPSKTPKVNFSKNIQDTCV